MEIKIEGFESPAALRVIAKAIDDLADVYENEQDIVPLSTNTVAETEDQIVNATVAMGGTVSEPSPADGDNDSDDGDNERDKAGIPWDERIHASTKSQNANGTWKRRRNVSDEEYQSVMAELAAPAPAATSAPEPATAPVVPPPPSTAPAPEQGELTWPAVLQRITAATAAGTYNHDAAQAVLAQAGVQALQFLVERPDLWGKVLEAGNA